MTGSRRRRGPAVAWCGGLALVLVVAACGESKQRSRSDHSAGVEHKAGIPIIPRGKITLATAQQERFLLEVEAAVSLDQAVSFYRSQLPLDRWEDLRIQQVAKGLWGLQAHRGMFELTGRIKRLDAQRVSIGFERRVRRTTKAWVPTVPPDVITLPKVIRWEERVFDAGGNRVEIRGRSSDPAPEVLARLSRELKAQGWSVDAPSAQRLRARRKVLKQVRELVYRVDPLPQGTQVALAMALDELAGAARPAPARAAPPRVAPDAGTSAPLAPVPPDLVLWKGAEPPAARREGDKILSVTYERSCAKAADLLAEVSKLLQHRGFKLLPQSNVLTGATDEAPTSVTASKGKRLVVAIVTKESTTCVVTLMQTTK